MEMNPLKKYELHADYGTDFIKDRKKQHVRKSRMGSVTEPRNCRLIFNSFRNNFSFLCINIFHLNSVKCENYRILSFKYLRKLINKISYHKATVSMNESPILSGVR